jgi:hypothetical protein
MKRASTASLVLVFGVMAMASPLRGSGSKQEAKELLKQCIATMGGLDRFRGVESISYNSIEHTFVHSVELSESLPQTIIYESHEVVMQLRSNNLSEKTNWRWTESNAQIDSRMAITPQGGFAEADNKRIPISASGFYKAIDILAANPISALVNAYDSSDFDLQRQTGGTYEISFRQPVYGQQVKTTLGISKQTHLLEWIEIEHSYSQDIFDAFWGPRAKRFVFSGWSLDASGVHFPLKRLVVMHGRVEGQESLFNLKINPELPASTFTIPDAFKKSFDALFHASAEDLAKGNHGDGDHLDVRPGVVMLPGKPGAYNSLIVKQDKGIVVIESPYSDANSEYVINYAHKIFPGTPITGIVSTNQLQFHLAGLPAYAKEHIPIYVVDANVDLVRRFLTAQDDEAAIHDREVKLRTVWDRTEIGIGLNRMVLIPFRGTTSARMMAVYFPEHKLLYCSDMYLPQSWGRASWTEHLSEIRDLIDREHIDVQQVLGVSMIPHDWKELSALIPAAPTDS